MMFEQNAIQQLDSILSVYDKVVLFVGEDDERLSRAGLGSYDKVFVWNAQENFGELKQLYFTYQFSDKFVFVSRKKACFPTIFSFVETGLLTMEEALEALLC